MQSKAATVEAYLAELPEDRRAAISALREVVRKNIDPLMTESMLYGMIGWAVPHAVYPAGYHCDPSKPVMYAALASQKGGMSLYLMPLYLNPALLKKFESEWKKRSPRKLDMGKSCIRFKALSDLPLDVIGETIASVSAKAYIERYQSILDTRKPMKRDEIKQAVAKRKEVEGRDVKAAKRATRKPVRAASKTPQGKK